MLMSFPDNASSGRFWITPEGVNQIILSNFQTVQQEKLGNCLDSVHFILFDDLILYITFTVITITLWLYAIPLWCYWRL